MFSGFFQVHLLLFNRVIAKSVRGIFMSEKNIIKTARFHHITAGMRFAYTHSNPAFGGTADNLKTHLSGSSPTGRNPTYRNTSKPEQPISRSHLSQLTCGQIL